VRLRFGGHCTASLMISGIVKRSLCNDDSGMPCISLRCTDICREKFKSGLADQKLIAVTPTSRRSSRVRPQIFWARWVAQRIRATGFELGDVSMGPIDNK
jgi:hypothetical protein